MFPVNVRLADGETITHDGEDRYRYGYEIRADGFLVVFHRAIDREPKTAWWYVVETVYAPGGWVSVTGGERDPDSYVRAVKSAITPPP